MGRVYTYYTQEEATRIVELLKSNNILCQIHSFEDSSPYNGAFRPGVGMGEIIVHEKDEEKAKKLISELKQDKES
jgi:predicted N-formylglutamate amidohydrolase